MLEYMCSNVQTALTTLRLGSRFTSILNDSSVGLRKEKGNTPDPAVRKRSAGFVLFPGCREVLTVSDLPVAVFAFSMATTTRGAPIPEKSALVANPQFQEILKDSSSLTHKILQSIPGAHRSCVNVETLRLNSSENHKLVTLASTIGIPSAPALSALSDNFTLNTMLRHMLEGLQLHKDLLNHVLPRLEVKDMVIDLTHDLNDLSVQVLKMLKLSQREGVSKPNPTLGLALDLRGSYEVQVAIHLILVQLQGFEQDMDRCLRSLEQNPLEEEAEY
uniref:Uncharacterized protein n=1 Tax=Oryzias sinensis TaxID=183150 RepID=A0A8C7YNG8_9TELE